MNLNIFKTKHRPTRPDEIRKKISETMKHTGAMWERYLELKPDGYNFSTYKQFRSYLKYVHDPHLIDVLNGVMEK